MQELEADRLTNNVRDLLTQPVVQNAKVSWHISHIKLVIYYTCTLNRLHCHRCHLDYSYQCFMFALCLVFLSQKVNLSTRVEVSPQVQQNVWHLTLPKLA